LACQARVPGLPLMRILHFDAGREMRGGQWQVLRLIEGLAAAGVESTLLARPGFPLFDLARQRGWRVEPLGLARAVLLARRHDLLHAHDAHGHTLATLVRGRPLVVSRRVAFPIGTGHVWSRWKYGRAARYLAVSEFVKGVLVEGGVAAEKIAVVPDGVPTVEPATGSAVLALQKGGTLAEEAARLAGVELKFARDLEHDLRDAGIFIYVTEAEGLGSGVLLAMSAGVAVAASRVGGLPEVIADRENGLLVENRAAAFAAAIRELKEDVPLARRLGEAARRTVLERFTVERMVRRTMENYRKVLSD
jgi:glycosyltransferase involved in cell wall biosynthesis